MNDDHDKQSELQRVLALKKHEAPPPRFFKGFSETVIDRLHQPEGPGDQAIGQRLLQVFESKPVLVCLSGVVVFGCLAAGLIASLRVSPPKADSIVANDGSKFVVAPSPSVRVESIPQLSRPEGEKALPVIDSSALVSESSAVDGARFKPSRASLPVAPASSEPLRK